MTMGIYVHVPFCVSKCHYCDFYSERIKANNVKLYLEALALELKLFEEMLPDKNNQAATLYFGGGTPSTLTVEQLTSLLSLIRDQFSLANTAEVTLEINPGTVTKDKLWAYHKLGINRLSIGVQSFNDKELAAMGRRHSVDQVLELIQWLKELQFDNYSLDLIYGLPGQSLEGWQDTLDKAITCDPKHISLYGLKLEEGTPWGREYNQGQLLIPDDGAQAQMYETAVGKLKEAGLNRYEISNFAKLGYAAQHNLIYWRYQSYLGFGPGASSFYQGKRWTNLTDIEEYSQKLKADWLPIQYGEELNQRIQEAEAIFLALRLTEGLGLTDFKARFNQNFLEKYEDKVHKFSKAGMLVVDANRVKLTERGVLLANEIFAEFLPD
ncbi:MAG: radical SAM family heme chaperone HemW [Bacillota bacterium]|nr:radical SAM family heme chaperone HemW [Bacillota bacterium]